MIAVLVPLRTMDGVEVTINPLHIAIIEPAANPPGGCIIRMALNVSLRDEATGQWRVDHWAYVFPISMEEVRRRIDEAQRRAREEWDRSGIVVGDFPSREN